jgi:hypothetical protein
MPAGGEASVVSLRFGFALLYLCNSISQIPGYEKYITDQLY